MRYISGIHALNLPCSLVTCGDWHRSALKWRDITFMDTETAFFKDYGIEFHKRVPEHDETYPVANHIRAILDLLETGKFSVAQGMNNDFICNDSYTEEVFDMVATMKSLPHWAKIDSFMGREYYSKWLDYKKRVNL